MITKFDKFLSSAVGTGIMRDTNDLQRNALARIVRVCGKLPLKNLEESIKSVYDKMLVRSLSFLADDDLVREEALKYDSILSTIGDSSQNPAIPVTDQFIGTKDGSAIGIATKNNGKGKDTPASNVVESLNGAASELQSYIVTIDEGVETESIKVWLVENGFTICTVYPYGVISCIGRSGVDNMPGAAIHEERTDIRALNEAANPPVTIDDLQAIQAYKDIAAMPGYAMTSSPMQLGRLTLQFGAPAAHRYIVYQNGAVRSLTAVNAATNMKRYDNDLITIGDWTVALAYVHALLVKRAAKDVRRAAAAGTTVAALPDVADTPDLGVLPHAPVAAEPIVAAAEPVVEPAVEPTAVARAHARVAAKAAAVDAPEMPVAPVVVSDDDDEDEDGPAGAIENAPELDVPASAAARTLSSNIAARQAYDAVKLRLRGLRGAVDVDVHEKIPGQFYVSWEDDSDVYDWNEDDDTGAMEASGRTWDQDQATVREINARFPAVRMSLEYSDNSDDSNDHVVTLSIIKQR